MLVLYRRVSGFQILPNRLADISQGFVFRLALRPTPGKPGAADAIAFFGLPQYDFIFHRMYSSPKTLVSVSVV